MSVININGDILKVQFGIICHQVNCMGKMGAGIALKIRKKWPIVYEDYIEAYNINQLYLGEVILSIIQPGELYIANLCGQYNYGTNKRYTEYKAIEKCLMKVSAISNETGLQVYIPKNMGCALAGGNWDIVEGLIKDILHDAVIVNYIN